MRLALFAKKWLHPGTVEKLRRIFVRPWLFVLVWLLSVALFLSNIVPALCFALIFAPLFAGAGSITLWKNRAALRNWLSFGWLNAEWLARLQKRLVRPRLFIALWLLSMTLFLSNLLPAACFALLFAPLFVVAAAVALRNITPIHRWNVRHAVASLLFWWLTIVERQRWLWRLLFGLLAFNLMLDATHELRPGLLLPQMIPATNAALRFLGRALPLLGIALLFAPRTLKSARVPRRGRLMPLQSNWLVAAAGVVMLALLAECNSNLVGLQYVLRFTGAQQMALLAGGIILLVWGIGRMARPRVRLTGEMGVVAVITLIALCVRLWQLELLVHKFIDEMQFGLFTRYLSNEPQRPLLVPYISHNYNFPLIFTWLQLEAVTQMGRNLGGLRVVSVAFGTLTIPALYFLARHLFDRTIASAAALLLATFPPHIQFSRIGINNVCDPLLGTLVLAFLAKGFQSNRRLDFALSGAMLGLTQYFYEGGRLLYPPLVLVWVGGGFLLWRVRPNWRGVLLMVLVALIVAAPIYLAQVGNDLPFRGRYEEESSPHTDYTSPEYRNHLKFSLLAITTLAEWRYPYFAGENGLVLWTLLPVLFVGILLLVLKFNTPMVLPIIWLAANVVGTSLLRSNVQTSRYVVSFPALALCLAVGIVQGIRLIFPAGQRWRRAQMAVIVPVVMAIGVYQVDYFFNQHIPLYNRQIWDNYRYAGEDALLRSADFAPGTLIVVCSVSALDLAYGQNILNYLGDGLTLHLMSPAQFTGGLREPLPQDRDIAFFVESEDGPDVAWLHQNYALVRGPYYSPYNVPPERKMVLYYIPAQQRLPAGVGRAE